MSEHSNGPKAGLQFDPVLRSTNPTVVRALEQIEYMAQKAGGANLLNRIAPVAAKKIPSVVSAALKAIHH